MRENKSDGVDAVTRAASIHAARQAFEEREEAKTRKHERKQERRRSRKDSLSSITKKKAGRSNTITSIDVEKERDDAYAHGHRRESAHGHEVTAISYEEMPRGYNAANVAALTAAGLTASPLMEKEAQSQSQSQRYGQRKKRAKGSGANKSSVKSSWLRFLIWFRVRLLRMGSS